MSNRKITVTTGARSEYGLLRPILKEIIKRKKLQLFLVVTGTHLSKKHGMTINEIKKDKFKIYETFKFLPHNDTGFSVAKSLGEGVVQFAKIFKKIKPDINLILGDRDEMLASAIAAYHMNIPNAHIHGGDVSGNIDEYTRHAITKISNIHFPATEKSKRRIIKMGENPKFVFLTGSPSIDELRNNEILSKKDSTSKTDDFALQKAVNKTVYNVTKNLDNFQYNVVIANMHEIYNLFCEHIAGNKTSNKTLKNEWEKITLLLMPLTPHLAHECYEKANKKFYWPKSDHKLLKEKKCIIVVQVDGRKRGILEMPINSDEKTVIKKCKKIANVSKHIANTKIIKNIYLKNRLVNFIIKK